jgi:ABC-type branched-subunit amino acid transport system substrate-binding protein
MQIDDVREEQPDPTPRRGLNRRQLLAGIGSAAAVAGTAPLAGSAADDLNAIKSLLKIDPKHAGKGLTFDIGAVYPITGPGALFGGHVSDIPNLAFKHIEMMGGPKFNLILKDNRSGDPQAGVQAVRELGFAKVPMMLSSYAADLGAMLAGIKLYKIFSIDGSGGTAVFADGKPYFWGSIAKTPNDALPGMIKFIHQTLSPGPDATVVSFVGWDLGPLNAIIAKDAAKYFKGANMIPGAAERAAIGSTDFSNSLTKIKASEPDVVACIVYGLDIGYFMKQYALTGINKPVIAFSHSAAAQQVAGPAYEGLYFIFDYFDPDRPANPWAKFYIEEFQKLEGTQYPPDNYGANTYEDCFTIWECIRRVLAKGGNPHDGAQLDAALREHPIFPSLYGGNASTAGTIEFDLQTHSVKRRPMTVAQFKNGKITPLAYFDLGGGNYRPA